MRDGDATQSASLGRRGASLCSSTPGANRPALHTEDVMRRSGLLIIAIAGLLSAVGTANAQCETTGECFCDPQGMVGIAQLIRGVNIALGAMDCPSISANACSCCACDFGGGDIQCGVGDTDCLDCQSLGGM